MQESVNRGNVAAREAAAAAQVDAARLTVQPPPLPPGGPELTDGRHSSRARAEGCGAARSRTPAPAAEVTAPGDNGLGRPSEPLKLAGEVGGRGWTGLEVERAPKQEGRGKGSDSLPGTGPPSSSPSAPLPPAQRGSGPERS